MCFAPNLSLGKKDVLQHVTLKLQLLAYNFLLTIHIYPEIYIYEFATELVLDQYSHLSLNMTHICIQIWYITEV